MKVKTDKCNFKRNLFKDAFSKFGQYYKNTVSPIKKLRQQEEYFENNIKCITNKKTNRFDESINMAVLGSSSLIGDKVQDETHSISVISNGLIKVKLSKAMVDGKERNK